MFLLIWCIITASHVVLTTALYVQACRKWFRDCFTSRRMWYLLGNLFSWRLFFNLRTEPRMMFVAMSNFCLFRIIPKLSKWLVSLAYLGFVFKEFYELKKSLLYSWCSSCRASSMPFFSDGGWRTSLRCLTHTFGKFLINFHLLRSKSSKYEVCSINVCRCALGLAASELMFLFTSATASSAGTRLVPLASSSIFP